MVTNLDLAACFSCSREVGPRAFGIGRKNGGFWRMKVKIWKSGKRMRKGREERGSKSGKVGQNSNRRAWLWFVGYWVQFGLLLFWDQDTDGLWNARGQWYRNDTCSYLVLHCKWWNLNSFLTHNGKWANHRGHILFSGWLLAVRFLLVPTLPKFAHLKNPFH